MGKKINTAQPIARVQENSWFEYSYLFGAYTLKNAGLFQSKFGFNMDKPKCWVKNVI